MIKVDLESLASTKQAIATQSAQINKRLVKACNDTAKHVRSELSKQIRNIVPIKKKSLDTGFRIQRAQEGSATPKAAVEFSDRGSLSLRTFGAKQSKRGPVRVKYAKGGPEATQATAKSGAVVNLAQLAFLSKRMGGHVFARTGKSRLPIAKLFGPSIHDQLDATGVQEHVQRDSDEFMARRMAYYFGPDFAG